MILTTSQNIIYKYFENSYGFYSKKKITKHRFAAIYIDTKKLSSDDESRKWR